MQTLGYVHTSSKSGKRYQLRKSATKSGMQTYFFTLMDDGVPRSSKGEETELPPDKHVVESPNGFPVLKRITSAAD